MPQSPLYLAIRPQVQHLIGHYQEQLVGLPSDAQNECAPRSHNLAAYAGKLKARPQAFNLGGFGGSLPNVDWAGVFSKFVASVTDLLRTMPGTAADKRQAVINAAADFYQQTLRPLLAGVVGMPVVFNLVVEPAIEKALPQLAGGLYDAIDGAITRLLVGQLQPNDGGAPVPGGGSRATTPNLPGGVDATNTAGGVAPY